jgi:mRNA interferase MazF
MEVVAEVPYQRGEVVLVNLDPTLGTEIRKTRPCVIVSPQELNEGLSTFIIAPMTTGGHAYPFRVVCKFKGTHGYVVLDQIRTVDRRRVIRSLGKLQPQTMREILTTLAEMFAP